MSAFGDIVGQERAIATLERSISTNRVAHAYLFTGPAGCGKSATAIALAAATNCIDHPGVGCSRGGEACASCFRIYAGNHPDIRVLERQGAAQIIPIETIRRDVLSVVGLPPHEANARWFIIDEATALPSTSANAILKTLEEPPARTHFVLATTAPDSLLPTIRSRCQRVSFSALSATEQSRRNVAMDDGPDIATLVDQLVAAIEGDDILGAAEAGAAEKSHVTDLLVALAVEMRARALADDDAATWARRGRLALDAEFAVRNHNAHARLAIEDLLYRLRDVVR